MKTNLSKKQLWLNKINLTKDDELYVGIDVHKKSHHVAFWLNDAPAVDFVTPADSLIQFIVDEMTKTAFEDTLTGIALTKFATLGVEGDPLAYLYDLVAADEYTKTINYGQLLEGYYIIENDRVLYTNSEILSSLKIKHLNRIIAFNPLD